MVVIGRPVARWDQAGMSLVGPVPLIIRVTVVIGGPVVRWGRAGMSLVGRGPLTIRKTAAIGVARPGSARPTTQRTAAIRALPARRERGRRAAAGPGPPANPGKGGARGR